MQLLITLCDVTYRIFILLERIVSPYEIQLVIISPRSPTIASCFCFFYPITVNFGLNNSLSAAF